MNTKPIVSIIMSTYNRAEFLPTAIKHITSQTYTNFELIVVYDHSTDKTAEILSEFSKNDQRIRIVRNENKMKLIKSLNIGLNLAIGKYIARADDDDPWINTEKLAEQISFLELNPEYVIVGTGTIVIDEQNKELFRYRQPNSDKSIRAKMLFGNPFIHSTVVFRKSIIDKTGPYDENLKDAEDWDLWMRIGMYGKLYNLPSYCTYRFYGRRCLSIKNRINVSKTRLHLIKKYCKQYPNFIPAFLFNSLQRMYAFSPYIETIDNFLFKLKRKILMR
jgi:glycosyltransferase involved in cell wall biosynthesis